jgi:hypothetical protein
MTVGSSVTALVPLHSHLKYAFEQSKIQFSCIADTKKAYFRCECKGSNAVTELPTGCRSLPVIFAGFSFVSVSTIYTVANT